MSSDTSLPILREGEGDGAVARQGGRIISRSTFLSEIEQVADQLPDRPFVVNFCHDRYRFTVAWAAAMSRGQITLLPASRSADAVAALRADYPSVYVLSDHTDADVAFGRWLAYPPVIAGSATAAPAFAAGAIAAVLFTSGSTGRPNPSPRAWGRLVASSRAAGKALGVDRFAGAALVATVPHAHSYGLESAVMLPLQHQLLLTAERPFFPADVAAALSKPLGVRPPTGHRDRAPGILVTTPIHLRALVGDAAGRGFGTSFRAGFVLSATAPLAADLAARAETAFDAPVYEIYGCSEAGQLATRRTIDGPVWRSLDGFHVHHRAGRCWASGPGEADVPLSDEIEALDRGSFILQGRTADLVNVAGKRGSLAYLTSQLIAIEGVKDGVFLVPRDNADGATTRLAAVAVAPGLDAATILSRLRGRIDAAFLPRPLHVVDALPRNDLGKLAQSDILRLMGRADTGVLSGRTSAAPQTADHADSGDAIAAQADGAHHLGTADHADTGDAIRGPASPIVLRFGDGHPAGPGHFPGNPIIPGAVLLDELIPALFPAGWSGEVQSAKFHHPVRPGDSLAVCYRTVGESTRFECRLTETQRLVLSGVLRTTFPSR